MDPALYTRDWHLLDLALERLGIGDLEPHEERSVRDHLAQCPACSERFEAMKVELAEPLPALGDGRQHGASPVHGGADSGGEVVSLPSRRLPMILSFAGGLFALAAGVVMLVLPEVDPQLDPEFQSRGAELGFEVWRQDGEEAVLAHGGDGVRAGDRLAFRVSSQGGGHLLVAGIDSELEPYACYPSDPSQGSAIWAASPRPVQLDAAIELDATPGQERLVALLCDESVNMDRLAPLLREAASSTAEWDDLPDLVAGCRQRELRLSKLVEDPP